MKALFNEENKKPYLVYYTIPTDDETAREVVIWAKNKNAALKRAILVKGWKPFDAKPVRVLQ